MPGMKWSLVFDCPPVSGSFGVPTGAPELGGRGAIAGRKWWLVFDCPPVSASIGMRTGAPKLGAGPPSVGAGITLIAMSFGSEAELLATLFLVTKAPAACA